MSQTQPQGYAARLATRLAAATGEWTADQLLAVLDAHALCIVRFDDGRWSVRVSHSPGEAQEERTRWCTGSTLREALEIAVSHLASDGGDA